MDKDIEKALENIKEFNECVKDTSDIAEHLLIAANITNTTDTKEMTDDQLYDLAKALVEYDKRSKSKSELLTEDIIQIMIKAQIKQLLSDTLTKNTVLTTEQKESLKPDTDITEQMLDKMGDLVKEVISAKEDNNG